MNTNDPRFPDYQCGAYRSQVGRWRYLDAVYRGREAWVDRAADGTLQPNALTRFYLPPAPQERGDTYQARVAGTAYLDKYAQAIRDFVGLVFSNDIRWVAVPQPILDCLGDARTFLMGRAIAAMRRGHSLVLVEQVRGERPSPMVMVGRGLARGPTGSPAIARHQPAIAILL